jgi:hypothetical protein
MLVCYNLVCMCACMHVQMYECIHMSMLRPLLLGISLNKDCIDL